MKNCKKSKNRLLILNTDEMEYSYGGVCPFMRNMHPYLAECFDVKYITLPQSWKRLPGSTRIKYLIYLFLHRKSLQKADFILSHGPEGSFVASYSGVPYAHVYHGNSNPMLISRFRIGKYFAAMYDRMFERIDKTSALIYTVGPARNERQRKLNNPICQDVGPQPIEKRRGFVFAGRLEKMKNVDRLIRIYAKLSKEIREENPFYIVGYGTQEQSLRDEVNELSKTEKLNVIFLGMVDNTMMLKTDANKRIMIMASSTEGMPTAIAEAFSVGIPVVTTAVGDIPSIVKDRVNGRLLSLDFKDEDYVAAIEDVLKHYEEYSKAAYEASKPFNRETITRMVINDIKQLINGGTC